MATQSGLAGDVTDGPDGSIENPVNPIGVAIGTEASFIARTVDVFQAHMHDVLRHAAEHSGAALVEIAQDCIILNDHAWHHLTDPDARSEHVLYLEHGKPMRFGNKLERNIRLNGVTPEIVEVPDVGVDNLLVHDEHAAEPTLAYLLSRMGPPHFPTPVGVFRAVTKPVFERTLATDRVADLQPHESVSVPKRSPAALAVEIMRERRIGCVLATAEDGTLAGILSESDLLNKVARTGLDLERCTVAELMTPAPETIRPEDGLAIALQRMAVGDHRHLPQVDAEQRPVGVASSENVINYLESALHRMGI